MNPMNKLPAVPASFFGMVLGIAGLGGAWRIAHRVWNLPAVVSELILCLAAIIWTTLIALYVAKWLWARALAVAELDHPIQCCFVGLIGVSTMLVAGIALPYSRSLSSVLFALGGIYTLAFAVWRTGGLWEGDRDVTHTTAVLYLPTVAGSFVMTSVASALGYGEWAQLSFGAGLFSWLALESVLLHRLLTAEPLAVAIRPALGIQLAPPTVGSFALLSLGAPHSTGILVHAMLGYGLLQALILIRLLPWITTQPFAASYWGFTFGATALAAVPLKLVELGERGPVAALAPYIFIAANLVLLVMAVGTLKLLVRGRLLAAPAAAPPSPST